MNESELLEWRRNDLVEVRRKINEFKEENKDAGFWMHMNELAEQFDDISDKIKMYYLRFKWGVESGISNGRLEHIKWAIENGYKEREKVGFKIASYLKRRISGSKKDGITDDMIERARRYPIENLIDIKRGMTNCISGTHRDKSPSMDARNNFCYCHACGYHADAIDVYMKLHGATFHEAVRALS